MCIYLKRQVRFKLILFGGRLEKPPAWWDGASLLQLWLLRLRLLCRWKDRASAWILLSLCHANACTHTACSSPLDATVIQLSLHQVKSVQCYQIAGSLTVIMNSALMTLATGPSKECKCQAVPHPQLMLASLVRWARVSESALPLAEKSPQTIIRLLF